MILWVSTKDWNLNLAGHDVVSMSKVLILYFQPIRLARFDNESVNPTSSAGAGKRSQFLVLNKRTVTSGNKNVNTCAQTIACCLYTCITSKICKKIWISEAMQDGADAILNLNYDKNMGQCQILQNKGF